MEIVNDNLELLIQQTGCNHKQAKKALLENNNDIDEAMYSLFCLLENKTNIQTTPKINDDNLTEAQKKIKELRKIVDIKDRYFCKVMEQIRSNTNNTNVDNINKND